MTTRKAVTMAALVGLVALCPSCARSGSTEPKTSDSEEQSAEAEAETSSDDSLYAGSSTSSGGVCDDRPCSVNAECCEGYGCGFDPQRSHVQRYCQAE
jgi:hypothetical protein